MKYHFICEQCEGVFDLELLVEVDGDKYCPECDEYLHDCLSMPL